MNGVTFFKKHTVIFSLGMLVLSFIVYLIGNFFNFVSLSESDSPLMGDTIGRILACVFIFVVTRWLLGKDFSLRFNKNNFGKGMLFISPIILMLLTSVITLLFLRDENGALYLSATTILLITASSIMTGFYEEILFRGLLTQNLLLNLSKYSLFKTVFFSSLAFSLIHIVQDGPVQMANAMLSGIFAAAIFIRTKNIWPAVIEHAMWDASIFLINTVGENGSVNSALIPLIEADPTDLLARIGSTSVLLTYTLGPILAIVGLFLLRKSKHAEIKELWGIVETTTTK